MFYRSSRSDTPLFRFKDVTLKGLADDGGLFVPVGPIPQLDWAAMSQASYQEVAASVLAAFAGDDLNRVEARELVDRAYGGQFADAAIAPLKKLPDGSHVLELFHGPTLAFKDMALQLLGQLFDRFTAQDNREITILGATSGDTGSAAIEAVRRLRRVRIVMLHPKGRVSDVQRRQMTTVDAPNVLNLAVDGTFDDCQALVKAAFAERDFARRVSLGAVNSINWARVMAQIVYYATSCLALGLPAEGVSFSVPTGNFGDIYAGYLAKRIGLPVASLVIATNANDILVRAHRTGHYTRGTVARTQSPSMDIQVSSNFERYLSHHLSPDTLAPLMDDVKREGSMILPDDAHKAFQADFHAERVSDDETLATIRHVRETQGYVMDPHTAIGYEALRRTTTTGHRVTLATAHPAKFPAAMTSALGEEAGGRASTLPQRLADLMTGAEHMEEMANDLVPLMKRMEAFSA